MGKQKHQRKISKLLLVIKAYDINLKSDQEDYKTKLQLISTCKRCYFVPKFGWNRRNQWTKLMPFLQATLWSVFHIKKCVQHLFSELGLQDLRLL